MWIKDPHGHHTVVSSKCNGVFGGMLVSSGAVAIREPEQIFIAESDLVTVLA